VERCYICNEIVEQFAELCEDCAGIISAIVAIETDRELGYIGLN
jgi:hypothetical protein